IAPPSWESGVDVKSADSHGKDRLHLRRKPTGMWQPEITVVHLTKAPDAAQLKDRENFKAESFQGAEALVFDRPIKKFWVYKVIFARAGEWFEASVATPDFEDVRHTNWYAYLESFRYPDPNWVPKKAATRPATSPSDSGH